MTPQGLQALMRDVALEEVDDGIFSCLPPAQRHSDYDSKVRGYDLLVGNRYYNRLVWGNWPSRYRAFCREALAGSRGGTYLDAGCGSLVFTADVYTQADNTRIVLLDRSLGMLAKGRDRIRARAGRGADNITFLQGDIFDLPFRDQVFDAVASYGVLHVFDDQAGMLDEMTRVRRPGGKRFFSSLVGNNALGMKYLELLKKAGEVATCQTSDALAARIGETFKLSIESVGNVAYARGG